MLLAVVLLITGGTARARSVNEIIIALPPVGELVTQKGTGAIPQVFQMVFSPLDLTLSIRPLTYAKAIEKLESGTIDCTIATAGAIANGLYAETPLFTADFVAVYSPSSGIQWSGPQSLHGRVIAYTKGLELYRILNVQAAVTEVPNTSEALNMLEKGFIEAVLTDSLVLAQSAKAIAFPLGRYTVQPLSATPVYPVFSPDERGRKLRIAYERRMHELTDNKDFLRLYEQWGNKAPFLQKTD